MDDLQLVKSFESSQDLSSDFPDHGNGKEGLIFLICYVQIILHQVRFNEKMLPVVEHTFELNKVLLIRVAVCTYVPEDLYFIQGLVKKVLVVHNHLQTRRLPLLQIQNLHYLRENALSQHTLHPVPPSQNIPLH